MTMDDGVELDPASAARAFGEGYFNLIRRGADGSLTLSMDHWRLEGVTAEAFHFVAREDDVAPLDVALRRRGAPGLGPPAQAAGALADPLPSGQRRPVDVQRQLRRVRAAQSGQASLQPKDPASAYAGSFVASSDDGRDAAAATPLGFRTWPGRSSRAPTGSATWTSSTRRCSTPPSRPGGAARPWRWVLPAATRQHHRRQTMGGCTSCRRRRRRCGWASSTPPCRTCWRSTRATLSSTRIPGRTSSIGSSRASASTRSRNCAARTPAKGRTRSSGRSAYAAPNPATCWRSTSSG